jgi:protein gp37
MAGKWWDESWNPVTGCTACSEGCAHCYAKAMHERLFQSTKFEKVVLHPERLDKPSRMRPGKVIFVDSMSDLFHEDVPFWFIADILWVMIDNPQHTFVVLTKRPERMLEFFGEWIFKGKTKPMPSKNIWFGVTAENQARADERIPVLLKAPVSHRFVSVEPMLGAVDLDGPFNICGPENNQWDNPDVPIGWLEVIDLVICGGESGTGARPMQPDWARGVRDQCVDAGVPFYFKQWGEWAPDELDGFLVRSRGKGRMLDGVEWNELPWRKSVEKLIDQPAEVQLALVPTEHLTPALSNGVVEGAFQEENL